MELKDTINMMDNADYKERFKAEFHQLHIRLTKLKNMVNKWDKKELNFEPTCPRDLYTLQIAYMELYESILIKRAEIEKVDLGEE